MPFRPTLEERPIRSMADERLDFNRSAKHRKSYLVASSYRSGSTYLCSLLWETGLLGAPTEVLNSTTNDSRLMMSRFKVSSPADYIAKLLAHRTSRNGVFGMKSHFHHFEAFLAAYPALLDVLAPWTFIYIDRADKLAQAVSMAKALQTNRWASRAETGPRPPLLYDRDLITKCIGEVEQQDARWLRWFDANNVTPFRVTYESLTADAAGTVGDIVRLLDAQNDEASVVHVPPAVKQSDDTNQEWIARFRQDTSPAPGGSQAERGDADRSAAPPIGKSDLSTIGGRFFDRHADLIKSLPDGTNTASGFVGVTRLRRRYDAIIAQNSALFHNARVLDLGCSHGFWSLAALDAGAAHVVGVDTSSDVVAIAKQNFVRIGVAPSTYQFVKDNVLSALKAFEPGQFDMILCKGIVEYCNVTELFYWLSELRPKYVILDTTITTGAGALARFTIAGKAWKGHSGRVMASPNHNMIAFLCEQTFRWRLVDWQAMGITDWTGIADYARDTHRTYVLSRL